jgi:translation initiation factor IF-1
MLMAALAGCAATQPPSGRVEDAIQSRATVTEVDLPERLVTLKDDRGQEIVLEVPGQVKSLDRVRAGDEVIVSYTTAVAWQVRRSGEAAPGVREQVAFNTEKAGEKPAGTLGRSVTLTTTITAIDLSHDMVTLSGPERWSRSVRVRDPADLRKVQVGDLVDITYSEAVAIAVRTVAKN